MNHENRNATLQSDVVEHESMPSADQPERELKELRLCLTTEYVLPFFAKGSVGFSIRSIDGEINAYDTGAESRCKLGEMALTQIVTSGSSDVTDACDVISSDLFNLAEDIFDGENFCAAMDAAYGIAFGDVLVINSIIVLPQYRGAGIGQLAIEAIIEAYAPACELIALKPFPIGLVQNRDHDESAREVKMVKKGIRRLQTFYERMGFRLLTDEHMTYCTEICRQPSVAECRRIRAAHVANRDRYA